MAAAEHLHGPLPIVSVLEGGYGRYDEHRDLYDRKSLATTAAAHVQALRNYAQQASRAS